MIAERVVKGVVRVQPLAWHMAALLGMLGLALTIHLWGIRQDLPFTPEIDEMKFVLPAMRIAAVGDLNPHWFGNPGSTIIYPLALIYNLWYAVAHGGKLFQPNPDMQAVFDATPGMFYLLGRLLAGAYTVLSIPFVYMIGRRAYGTSVALLGAWFAWLAPIALINAQMVRTDSAGTFFALLSLWLCLRVYDQPTRSNHILAGLAIGFAIASRYFMVVLVPVLLAVDALVIWRQPSRREAFRQMRASMAIGLFMALLAFALTTPFFFLDPRTTWQSIKREARTENLGADGLSPIGNLWWYLSNALFASITWPRVVLTVIGIALAVGRRYLVQLLLLLFVVGFLAGISMSGLHWQRWLIPILPVLALFAADALRELALRLSHMLALKRAAGNAVLVLLVLLTSGWPMSQMVQVTVQNAQPSTRILAREWILQHLPRGSRIALEWYTAPLTMADFQNYAFQRKSGSLTGNNFVLYEDKVLAANPLADYRKEGYQYLVVSSEIYERYFAEARRYPTEVAFYQNLFTTARLVQQFAPSATRGGPTIRVYQINGMK